MDWIYLQYEAKVKDHYVYHSAKDLVEEEIFQRYQIRPIKVEKVQHLHIDPGGMICTANQLLVSNFENSNVSIRPELILSALITWSKHRMIDNDLVKVYCNQYSVAVLPKDLYQQIGSWLAFKKADGYVARMGIVEALNKSPHLIVLEPPSEGDA